MGIFIFILVYFFYTDDCVAFLKKQAVSLGLPLHVYSVVCGKPIVVLTWEGSEPALPSVLLNSHMDVVPVFPVSSAPSKD
jgi:aminoacylase